MTKNTTASGIVAEALNRSGQGPITEDEVAKIYKRVKASPLENKLMELFKKELMEKHPDLFKEKKR
jgi:hypothetical protein